MSSLLDLLNLRHLCINQVEMSRELLVTLIWSSEDLVKKRPGPQVSYSRESMSSGRDSGKHRQLMMGVI